MANLAESAFVAVVFAAPVEAAAAVAVAAVAPVALEATAFLGPFVGPEVAFAADDETRC